MNLWHIMIDNFFHEDSSPSGLYTMILVDIFVEGQNFICTGFLADFCGLLICTLISENQGLEKSRAECQNSQNGGLEDYSNISDGIFPCILLPPL